MSGNRNDLSTRRKMLAKLAGGGVALGATYAFSNHPMFVDTVSANPSGSMGKNYYVKAGAASTNDGLSPARPFPTIQQAADLTLPGDTVYVMNGTYTETSNQGAVVITRSGAPDAYITYRAFPGHRPVTRISTSTWNHIRVLGASYIQISGFTVEGNSASFTIEEALANQAPLNPKYNANGIVVVEDKTTGQKPHHIRIIGNTVHHCPGGGISVERTDYATIEKNVVYSNAWTSVYANSGISLFHSYDFDTETGYKNFIQQNISYDNQSYIPWGAIGRISDGNGIIVDDLNNSQINQPPYLGRTYVANNLAFENGGSGIHAYHCENVDIVNNTVYNNARSPELDWAPLFANSCNKVNLLNNISYGRAGKKMIETYRNTNVTYDYNIYYNGITPTGIGPHDLVVNPLLNRPSGDPNVADFGVHYSSPGLESGTSHLAPSVDLKGWERPRGKAVDRGAYEGSGPRPLK